jgi:hypothetical protein
MLNTIHKIVAGLAVALGLVHSALTIEIGTFDIDALWFAGSGLAIIFAGFLNLAFIRTSPKDLLVRWLCIIADFTLTILFVVAFFTVLHEPQVVLGSLVFAAATVFSILQKSE